MKNIYCLIIILSFPIYSFSQFWDCFGSLEIFDFDGNAPNQFVFEIDTFSNPNNSWQIGVPQKSVITSANSAPNAIITDSVMYYATGDTSIFIMKEVDEGGYSYGHTARLAGYYQVDTDSLKDYGLLEISLNQKASWINLLTDTIYNMYFNWETVKPTLTGNSNGWQFFSVSLVGLSSVFQVDYGDTIFFKVTFISDTIADTLDGLAFDDFQLCNYIEGLYEISNNYQITVSPNPFQSEVYLKIPENFGTVTSVEVYSNIGQKLKITNDYKPLSLQGLESGFYTAVVSNQEGLQLLARLVKE